MFFLNIRVKEGVVATVICKIAPYTLGVYLLHEQVYVRYLWPKWLDVKPTQNVGVFLIETIGKVLIVFVVGIIVDYLRSLLFKAGSKLIHVKKD